MDSIPGGDMSGGHSPRPGPSNRPVTPGLSNSSQILRNAGGSSRGFSIPSGRRPSPAFENCDTPRSPAHNPSRVATSSALTQDVFEPGMEVDQRMDSGERLSQRGERPQPDHDHALAAFRGVQVRYDSPCDDAAFHDDGDSNRAPATPLDRYRYHKARVESTRRNGPVPALMDVEFKAEYQTFRAHLGNAAREQTLTPEEKEILETKEIILDDDSDIIGKNRYYSSNARYHAEIDMPKKRKMEEVDSSPRKRTKKLESKVSKSLFNRQEYQGINVKQLAKDKTIRKLTEKGQGRKKKNKKGDMLSSGHSSSSDDEHEPSIIDSLGVSDAFMTSTKIADAPDTPKFTSDKRGDAINEMVAGMINNSSNLKRAKEIGKADKKELTTATARFRKNNKPTPHEFEDGSQGWKMGKILHPLKVHQIIAAAWMCYMEGTVLKGGLLADGMGLGKTIETLAMMADRRPDQNARKNGKKTTLIVVPPAITQQWREEILKFCGRQLKVLIWDANARLSKNHTKEDLEERDVIIAPYSEVCFSFPNDPIPSELDDTERQAWSANNFEANRGLLHKIHFYRVVLDEAHCIKNPTSAKYIACSALMATHRWLLTGTPIVDGLEELYAYLKFLKAQHSGCLKDFKQNYCDISDLLHPDRVRQLLRLVMLRRTHENQLFGAPIVKLPLASQHTLEVELSAFETSVYDIILDRFEDKYMSANGKIKKANVISDLMMALRKTTTHWILGQKEFNKFNQETRAKVLSNFDQQADLHDTFPNNIKHLHQQLYGATDDAEIQLGERYGRKVAIRKFFEQLRDPDEPEPEAYECVCSICHEPPAETQVNHCGHFYCFQCYEPLMMQSDAREVEIPCPYPGCESYLDDVQEATSEKIQSLLKGDTPGLSSATKLHPWVGLEGQFPPSSKTLAAKIQILRWMKKDPKCKIIIFTEFTDMVTLMHKICKSEKWTSCMYHGGLTNKKRNEVIEKFQNDPDMQILIATTKSCGQGLNLTVAKFVLMFDIWWNVAMDQQAFARVWRIGQTEETEFVRLSAKGTIDEKVFGTQETKAEAIYKAMKVKDGLTHDPKEILALFATKRKAGGKAFKLVLDKPIPLAYFPAPSGNVPWKRKPDDSDSEKAPDSVHGEEEATEF